MDSDSTLSHVETRIVCVPSRLSSAKNIQNILRSQTVDITCDIRYTGSWNGTRNAWLSGLSNKKATHVMTLEDDILPCKDFIKTVHHIADLLPNEVITFYSLKSESNMVKWADKNDSCWYVTDGNASGQAVMIPRAKLIDFLRITDAFIDPTVPYEDARLWGWQQLRHYLTWTTVPNLVEHAMPTQSTLGFNSAGKTSPCFIGEDVSGMDIDWMQGLDSDKKKIFKGRVSETFLENFKGAIKNV